MIEWAFLGVTMGFLGVAFIWLIAWITVHKPTILTGSNEEQAEPEVFNGR